MATRLSVHSNIKQPFPHILSADPVNIVDGVRRAAVIEEYCLPAFGYSDRITSMRFVLVLVVNYDRNGNAFDWYICRGLTPADVRDWAWITHSVSARGDKILDSQAIEFMKKRGLKIDGQYRQ